MGVQIRADVMYIHVQCIYGRGLSGLWRVYIAVLIQEARLLFQFY